MAYLVSLSGLSSGLGAWLHRAGVRGDGGGRGRRAGLLLWLRHEARKSLRAKVLHKAGRVAQALDGRIYEAGIACMSHVL